MAMQKFQSVEKVEVVPAEVIAVRLAKVAATSAAKLTDEERAQAQLLDK